MSQVIIEPCGCEESDDLRKALMNIKKARQEFDLYPGADWGILVKAIDENINVLDAYEFAREKLEPGV